MASYVLKPAPPSGGCYSIFRASSTSHQKTTADGSVTNSATAGSRGTVGDYIRTASTETSTLIGHVPVTSSLRAPMSGFPDTARRQLPLGSLAVGRLALNQEGGVRILAEGRRCCSWESGLAVNQMSSTSEVRFLAPAPPLSTPTGRGPGSNLGRPSSNLGRGTWAVPLPGSPRRGGGQRTGNVEERSSLQNCETGFDSWYPCFPRWQAAAPSPRPKEPR